MPGPATDVAPPGYAPPPEIPPAPSFASPAGSQAPPSYTPPPPPPPMPPPSAAPQAGGGYDPGYSSGVQWDGYSRVGPVPANINWIADAGSIVTNDLWPYVVYFLLLFVLQIILGALAAGPGYADVLIALLSGSSGSSGSGWPSRGTGAGQALSQVLQWVVQIVNGIIMAGVASNLLRKLRFDDPLDIMQTLRDGFSLAVPAGIYTIVVSILVGIGTCFCILPGVWLSGAMYLGYFRLADGSPDFWNAFQDGLAVIQADVLGYFFLVVLTGLVYVLGFMLCGVGALWTMPIASVAWALAYRANFERG